MFDNISQKIKVLASAVCWIGIVLSIIGGIAVGVLIGDETAGFLAFLLIAIVGSLISWTGSFFVYGFGELIERVTNIENAVAQTTKSDTAENSAKVPQHNLQRETTAKSRNAPGRFLGFLGNCQICGKTGVLVTKAKVTNGNGTVYTNACKECFEKVNGK